MADGIFKNGHGSISGAISSSEPGCAHQEVASISLALVTERAFVTALPNRMRQKRCCMTSKTRSLKARGLPSFSWDAGPGTQPARCEEVQATWRGCVWVSGHSPVKVSANSHFQPPDTWGWEPNMVLALQCLRWTDRSRDELSPPRPHPNYRFMS